MGGSGEESYEGDRELSIVFLWVVPLLILE